MEEETLYVEAAKTEIIDDALRGTMISYMAREAMPKLHELHINLAHKTDNERAAGFLLATTKIKDICRYAKEGNTMPNFAYQAVRKEFISIYGLADQRLADQVISLFFSLVEPAYRNASQAIMAVVFGQYDTPGGKLVQQSIEKGDDPYRFVSHLKNGREQLKSIDEIDKKHILAKFAMAGFGIQQKPFSLTKAEATTSFQTGKYDNITELFAYVLAKDPKAYETYGTLFPESEDALVDAFFRTRYYEGRKNELDAFTGALPFEPNQMLQLGFLESYQALPRAFASIKREMMEENFWTPSI